MLEGTDAAAWTATAHNWLLIALTITSPSKKLIKKPSLTHSLTIVTKDTKAAKEAYGPLGAGVEGTYLARDLVNLPPNVLYPGDIRRPYP